MSLLSSLEKEIDQDTAKKQELEKVAIIAMYCHLRSPDEIAIAT